MTDERPTAPILAPRPRVLPKPAADEAQDPIYATPITPAPEAVAGSAPAPVEPVTTPVAEAVPELAAVVAPAPATEAEPATVEKPAVGATAAAAEPAVTSAPPARVRRQEVFVQIGSRVTVETRDMLDDIIAREGLSMRHTLEKMIRKYHSEG